MYDTDLRKIRNKTSLEVDRTNIIPNILQSLKFRRDMYTKNRNRVDYLSTLIKPTTKLKYWHYLDKWRSKDVPEQRLLMFC